MSSSASPPAAAAASALPTLRSARSKRASGLLWVLLLLGLSLGLSAFVLTSFRRSTVYAKGVDQLLEERSRWLHRTVRMEGTLVPGTLLFRDRPCEYRFDATRAGKTVHVRYASCVKPDTLRDDMPDVGVTAEGKLEDGDLFMATNVLAKCPSKYEQKDRAGRLGTGGSNASGTPR